MIGYYAYSAPDEKEMLLNALHGMNDIQHGVGNLLNGMAELTEGGQWLVLSLIPLKFVFLRLLNPKENDKKKFVVYINEDQLKRA